MSDRLREALPAAYDRARRHLAVADASDDPACVDCFGRQTVEPLLDHIDALRAALEAQPVAGLPELRPGNEHGLTYQAGWNDAVRKMRAAFEAWTTWATPSAASYDISSPTLALNGAPAHVVVVEDFEAEARQPVAGLDAIMREHRLCGTKYEGCYAHYPWMDHCRADGMAWPCDVDAIRSLLAEQEGSGT